MNMEVLLKMKDQDMFPSCLIKFKSSTDIMSKCVKGLLKIPREQSWKKTACLSSNSKYQDLWEKPLSVWSISITKTISWIGMKEIIIFWKSMEIKFPSKYQLPPNPMTSNGSTWKYQTSTEDNNSEIPISWSLSLLSLRVQSCTAWLNSRLSIMQHQQRKQIYLNRFSCFLFLSGLTSSTIC